jgi:hypothetical protein
MVGTFAALAAGLKTYLYSSWPEKKILLSKTGSVFQSDTLLAEAGTMPLFSG